MPAVPRRPAPHLEHCSQPRQTAATRRAPHAPRAPAIARRLRRPRARRAAAAAAAAARESRREPCGRRIVKPSASVDGCPRENAAAQCSLSAQRHSIIGPRTEARDARTGPCARPRGGRPRRGFGRRASPRQFLRGRRSGSLRRRPSRFAQLGGPRVVCGRPQWRSIGRRGARARARRASSPQTG